MSPWIRRLPLAAALLLACASPALALSPAGAGGGGGLTVIFTAVEVVVAPRLSVAAAVSA